MKHHRYLSIPAILLVALTIFVSCQENPEIDVISRDDDSIMAKAFQDATAYVDDLEANIPEGARADYKRPEIVCLVYKFQNGNGANAKKLLYKSWDNRKGSYVEVTEEEITAIVKPNTIIAHFRGAALSSLNAIEFDEASLSIIGAGNNFEYWKNYCWITFIPPTVPEDAVLKYDIVYDARNDGNGPIRLDPKVVVADE